MRIGSRSHRIILPAMAWACALLLVMNAIDAWRPVQAPATRVPAHLSAPRPPHVPNRKQLAQRADQLRSRNPFRLDRTPTARRFGLLEPSPGAPVVQAPAPVVPVLTLAGILGGPPWSAIIEGIPGHETGITLRVGEAANGVRLEWVRRDTAKITAADKAWIVTFKKPWH
jgi:hypothetical protein